MTIVTLVIAIAAIIVAIIATVMVSRSMHKKAAANKVDSAENKAREIIDDAVKTAEAKKREALIEAKEDALKQKKELDKEIRERRSEIQRNEHRLTQKEENLDRKLDQLEKREKELSAKEAKLNKEKEEVAKLNQQRVQELERISGLTSVQAKEQLLQTVEDDVKIDAAKLIKETMAQAKDDANKKARDIVVTAIQKCAADHVAETSISVVPLPSDDMKGRIIGREGRNIRTLETMTGVELIIDDTPEAVVLSAFDPVRREIARVALENAASIAGMFLTTECLIVDKPEEKPAMPMGGAPGMGGMM